MVNMTLKLIDLDAATVYNESRNVGSKGSTAYCPPEMIWKTVSGKYVRLGSYELEVGNPQVRLDEFVPQLLPHPSQDMWSFGCVLYLLCTGSTLFQCSVEDNITKNSDFKVLLEWCQEEIEGRGELIKNKLARNLVSLLLTKDPLKRPSARQVLLHPFFSGVSATRLVGEPANWDVFISYRSVVDAEIAALIYEHLTSCGLRVWWDKKCLRGGQNWEEGFCSGLVDSSIVLCLMSRLAVNNPSEPKWNFEKLERSSHCDNVLLEWRLALELKERGMLRGILPVMIGDLPPDSGLYANFFQSGCKPNPPDVAVDSVESKLRDHLYREGLGLPFGEYETVNSLLSKVLLNQGVFIEGQLIDSVKNVCSSVLSAITALNCHSHALL